MSDKLANAFTLVNQQTRETFEVELGSSDVYDGALSYFARCPYCKANIDYSQVDSVPEDNELRRYSCGNRVLYGLEMDRSIRCVVNELAVVQDRLKSLEDAVGGKKQEEVGRGSF